jgi:hypothetical protein
MYGTYLEPTVLPPCCGRMIFIKAEHRPKHVGYNIISKLGKIYYNPLVHRDDETILRIHNVISVD